MMSRPKKDRSVKQPPLFRQFKPIGVPAGRLSLVELTLDEYEAIRLSDLLGMEHSEAALEMEISRSTFTRLIEKARAKTALMLVEGKMLQIEGGSVHFRGNILRCHDCGHMFNTGFEDPISVCPSCGSERLLDLAGGFGHGKCCGRHLQKGGQHATRRQNGPGRHGSNDR
jgi:predicted DNA-binding protein (UPF0251 family)